MGTQQLSLKPPTKITTPWIKMFHLLSTKIITSWAARIREAHVVSISTDDITGIVPRYVFLFQSVRTSRGALFQNRFKGSIYVSAIPSKSFMLWWRWLNFAIHAICAGPMDARRWFNCFSVLKRLVTFMLITPFSKTLLDIMVDNMEKAKRLWSNQAQSGLENLCIKVNIRQWFWNRLRPV